MNNRFLFALLAACAPLMALAGTGGCRSIGRRQCRRGRSRSWRSKLCNRLYAAADHHQPLQ